ncbi:arylsulfatase J-like isoform X2 [Sycon ciliatum]
MSGRHPVQTGLQHGVIRDSVPNGLPLNETTIAQMMKKLGYATHMIGKWHLGFYKPAYTPQRRGFDTYFGYYTGNEEFWNHTSPCWTCGNYTAVDLHRATPTTESPVLDQAGVYSTNMFSDEAVNVIKQHDASTPLYLYLPFEAVHGAASCDPDCYRPAGDLLQAPDYYIKQQSHIENMYRRTYAGMVGALDDAVRNITAALKTKGMWENTVFVFTTDNGAPASFDGAAMNNWPLRGTKGTLWEGGVRGASFVTAPGRIDKSLIGKLNNELMHVTDWFPTFVHLGSNNHTHATALLKDMQLYGVNVWDTISKGAQSGRDEILHNIDPLTGQMAIRSGDWKLMIGMGPARWYPPANMSLSDGVAGYRHQDITILDAHTLGSFHQGDDAEKLYLFNITADPYERNEVSASFPAVVSKLSARLKALQGQTVPCRYPDPDDNANPNLPGRNGVWEPWMKDDVPA